jgi:hypothetical protein
VVRRSCPRRPAPASGQGYTFSSKRQTRDYFFAA